ncbi:hypothetical protein GCM10023238_10710 [Streptomyces heliomycini]
MSANGLRLLPRQAHAHAHWVQDLHLDKNDWVDTGFPLPGQRGGWITEGRHGSLRALAGGRDFVLGSHTSGQNEQAVGIACEGAYHAGAVPPDAQWDVLVTLCAYVCARYGIPSARLHGHKEYGGTLCPGVYHEMLPGCGRRWRRRGRRSVRPAGRGPGWAGSRRRQLPVSRSTVLRTSPAPSSVAMCRAAVAAARAYVCRPTTRSRASASRSAVRDPKGDRLGRGAEGGEPFRPERLVGGDRHRDRRRPGAQRGRGGAGSGVVDHRGQAREQQGVRQVPDGERSSPSAASPALPVWRMPRSPARRRARTARSLSRSPWPPAMLPKPMRTGRGRRPGVSTRAGSRSVASWWGHQLPTTFRPGRQSEGRGHQDGAEAVQDGPVRPLLPSARPGGGEGRQLESVAQSCGRLCVEAVGHVQREASGQPVGGAAQ